MDKLSSSYLLQCLTLIALTAPFLAFLLSLMVTKKAAGISMACIAVSFFASSYLFFEIWGKITLHFSWPWIALQNVKINLGILLNNLSVLMLLLITFIALLVNIYSVAYMKSDPLKHRYFSYLSLFCFAMMCVVVADNLFLLYAFWELVGFSSYLLIGFWFTREKAVQANKKAFIMNRIGDVGFLIGIMILLHQFHTLDINALFAEGNLIQASFVKDNFWISPYGSLPAVWLTVSGLCFFAGAIAKSAQFPLHTWLPDAMEGPTAVSSLIHAATMVAAGVFLLVRVAPLFNEVVLTTMAIIGLFTAFMAATIATTQNDIKKVLAFSTISQLGFMVLAVGVSNHAAAIFHLATHAFFKCLLFLGAGVVIHQLHHLKEKLQLEFDEQDMGNMGGLRKWMPITFFMFIIAACALAGLPFSSGYLSKDAILLSVFQFADAKGGIYWLFPLFISITSWLTTFYIFRLVFKVFYGEFKLSEAVSQNLEIRDANAWMRIPLMVLGLFCLAFLFSVNPFSLESSWLYQNLKFSVHHESMYELIVPVYINMMSFFLIAATYLIYAKQKYSINLKGTCLYKLSYHQWYFNNFYDVFLMRVFLQKTKAFFWFDKNVIDRIVHIVSEITLRLAKLSAWLDIHLVDGIVNGAAEFIRTLGTWLRGTQNGKLQHYFVWMLVLFLTFMIYKIIL